MSKETSYLQFTLKMLKGSIKLIFERDRNKIIKKM